MTPAFSSCHRFLLAAAMMSLLLLLLSTRCVVVVLSQISEFEPPEKLVYSVHYSSNDCEIGTAVSIHTIVVNEIFNVTGGITGGIHGMCSYETTCLHNPNSPLCYEEFENHTKNGQASKTMDKYKVLAECDTTNDPAEHGKCFIVQGCRSSSLFANCRYSTYTSSKLFANPELVLNTNATDAGLERTSYMVFYEDYNCTNLVGLEAIVTGTYNVTIAKNNTNRNYSCEDALRCFVNPYGDYCTGGDIDPRDKYIDQIHSETRNDGRDVYQCYDDSGNNSGGEMSSSRRCDLVPNTCMPSPIPSCYYRWVSGVELFENPGMYLNDGNIDDDGTADSISVLQTIDEDCSSSSSFWSRFQCNKDNVAVILIVVLIIIIPLSC